MSAVLKKPFPATSWVYFFILAHTLCWTLGPVLTRYNLPLDAIEGAIWGHQLEWGYDKNPYLNGWLTALASTLDGSSGWMIYLFSQLSVAACLYAVYQIGCRILSHTSALIAVLMLEGMQYFNFHAIDFNDNTLELGLWGLSSYFFYRAMRENGRYWLAVGACTGLGMMAKYYTSTLLLSMFLFMLSSKQTRKQFTTLSPYLGLIVFLCLTLPHIHWLFSHDFITVKYVFARGGSGAPHWSNHFVYPLQFVWQQLQVFAPALIIYAIFFVDFRNPNSARQNLQPFDRQFLFYIGFGPLLLTLLLSLCLGTYLRAGWGMPLLSLWGMILVALLPPKITSTRLYAFIGATFLLMAALLTGYYFSLAKPTSPSTANYPGRIVANYVTQYWHDTYHQPLHYLAGSRWAGGNIAYYSSDHPAVFIEWKSDRAPWINVDDLRRKGAVFVWDISGKESLPDAVRQQFTRLRPTQVLEFDWHRQSHQSERVKVGIAILPPG